MMSISAEPSLVDQHSAVACSPAEPLWNQASASLSEKKHSILVSSQKLTGSILYLQNERQVLKNNFWSFGLASSQGLEQRLCCNAQRIESIHRNHTPDVDHGQPQFLRVVFYFSVFLSFVFSRWTKAGTTTTSWMRRIGGRLKILQHWKQIEGNWCFDLEIISYIQEIPYQENTNLAGQWFFPHPMDGLRKNSARLFGGRGSPGSSNLVSRVHQKSYSLKPLGSLPDMGRPKRKTERLDLKIEEPKQTPQQDIILALWRTWTEKRQFPSWTRHLCQ